MIAYENARVILEKVAASRLELPKSKKLYDSVSLMDSTTDATGRILASDVLSTEEVPAFSNSSMDGFAVLAQDTQGATSANPLRIPVRGFIAAGDVPAFKAACSEIPGTSVEIMTGAPLPGCYDAVIPIEDVVVERTPDGIARSICVAEPAKSGDYVRLRGTDFTVGQLVLSQGTRIAPEHIMACASLGITKLRVKCRPRVAIISTGRELVAPETATSVLVNAPGMIRNSTGPFLLAALRRLGVEAHDLGVVADDPALYQKTLEGALSDGAEIVISTGAVSMGKFDFVPEVLREMGATTHFHKAAVRPGKPILFAEFDRSKDGSVFFGLPGNPVATAVGMRFFVEPYLRAVLKLQKEQPISARLMSDAPKPEGLRCFFKGRARTGVTGIEVQALKGQASYVVSALLEANCWVVFPENRDKILANTPVEIYPLHNAFERGVLE